MMLQKISLIFCLLFLNVKAWATPHYDPAQYPDLNYKDLTFSSRMVVTKDNKNIILNEYSLKYGDTIYWYKQKLSNRSDQSIQGVISASYLDKYRGHFTIQTAPSILGCANHFPPISIVTFNTDAMITAFGNLNELKERKYVLFCGASNEHQAGTLFVHDIESPDNNIVISFDLKDRFDFFKNIDGSYSIPVYATYFPHINTIKKVYYPIYYQLGSLGFGMIGITQGTGGESTKFYKKYIEKTEKKYNKQIKKDPALLMSMLLTASQIRDKKTYCFYLDKLEKVKLQKGPDNGLSVDDELKTNLVPNIYIDCKGANDDIK